MFSESRTPAPGEQRSFKPHAPHFIPWLRNSLKPQHASGGGGGGGGGDLGLNGPYKSVGKAEANRNSSLAPLEKAKGIGIFSSNPAKSRAKKELRFNAAGVARILPVVLRGHHILPGPLGKQKEEGGSAGERGERGERPPELDPEPETRKVEPQQQEPSEKDQNPASILQSDGAVTLFRKYGPLMEAAPSEPDRKLPVRGPEEAAPGWLSSDISRESTERQRGFPSSFTLIRPKSSSSRSHRDLTALRDPPSEGPGRPLNGLIFSTEVPLRGLAGCSTSLRSSRKHRLSLDHSSTLGVHSHTWTQRRSTNEGREPARTEAGAGCSRKVVRHQIKRVVDNLEQVLRALRDVHQEMSEVVCCFLSYSSSLNSSCASSISVTQRDFCIPSHFCRCFLLQGLGSLTNHKPWGDVTAVETKFNFLDRIQQTIQKSAAGLDKYSPERFCRLFSIIPRTCARSVRYVLHRIETIVMSH